MIWRALCLWAALLATGAAQAAPCRQALVLALDVSGSVDAREYRLQLDGLAAALEHADVVRAVMLGPAAEVRLFVFEWSGPNDQRVLIDWYALRDAADLSAMAARLRAMRRADLSNETAVGSALAFAQTALQGQAGCWVRTIDISGDGLSNTGPEPRQVRDALGTITINALVIGDDDARNGDMRQADVAQLSAYFRTSVITGPDAFVQVAIGYDDYEQAMVAKLVRELEPGLFGGLP